MVALIYGIWERVDRFLAREIVVEESYKLPETRPDVIVCRNRYITYLVQSQLPAHTQN